MNQTSKRVFLTTLTEYIDIELRRGRSDLAKKYIRYFNQTASLERNIEDFQTYGFFTDIQGFIAQSLQQPRLE